MKWNMKEVGTQTLALTNRNIIQGKYRMDESTKQDEVQ